jgi:predicted lipid-binding transport protein (Tim44 family)
MGIQYADIIFFAIVAAYLGLKLFSTLGKRDKDDNGSLLNNISARAAAEAERLSAKKPTLVEKSDLKDKELKDKAIQPKAEPEIIFINETVEANIKEISAKDAAFSVVNFLNGAKIAFEMAVESFAKKDKATLQTLLSEQLFVSFSNSIDEFSAKGLQKFTDIVSISKAEIVEASLNGTIARIRVDFVSEQISVTKDESGNIIEGSQTQIDEVDDSWVFERNITSKAPNWEIVAV